MQKLLTIGAFGLKNSVSGIPPERLRLRIQGGFAMKVLIVGGAGHVGTTTLPYMKSHHQFRILDLSPPKDSSVDYIQGSVTDPQIVQRAVKG